MNVKFSNRATSLTIGIALALREIKRRPLAAFGAAFFFIALATLLQWLLKEQYAGAPFLLIYPGIILSTFAGGLGAGLFSAILAGASQFGVFIAEFHAVAFGSYALDAMVCVALIVLINRTIDTLWTNDALTGLPNRTVLSEQLTQALKRNDREGERIALLYIDLGHLTRVNETLGQLVGDKLIQDAANRLRGCIRDVDFAARLNGGEFAIIQSRLKDSADAAELALRVRQAISEPFRLDGQEVKIDASVGIAIAPDDGRDVNELLKAADIARFMAKSAGPGNSCFYRAEMNESMQRRNSIERELRQALHNGEFELFYQPVISIKENRIRSFEALLRWRHPERGLVSPSEFIPIAEEIGLIVPLGEWVLRTACAEAVTWVGVNVAVNVSAKQLANGSFKDIVAEALQSTGLPPNRLIIEITESIFLANTRNNLETLQSIRRSGVQCSMDDFGAGNSSLAYLLSFPFNKIKIDQTFIAGLPHKRESRAIVRAIADLARELKIRVVAEGVETWEQHEEVRKLGCTDLQGYFISVPLPAHEVRDFIRTYELEATKPGAKVA